MKKGFTLIELLAVIIILAVISIIATPIVMDIIDDSRDSADKSSVYNIIDSAKLYYSESIFDNNKANKISDLGNIYDDVVLGGNKPENGKLYVNTSGNVAMSVIIRDKCYKKEFAGNLTVSDDSECDLGYIGNDTIIPTVLLSVNDDIINSNGWAKNDFYVNITVNDLESGGYSYKRCIDSVECNPEILVENSIGSTNISVERENVLCVIGYDKAGNVSEKVCETYKLDKTMPEFNGIGDITVMTNDLVDLTNGVNVSDSLSGIDDTYTYNPTSVDTSIAGTTNITYSVSDKASNTKTITRKVIVDALAPTVSYEPMNNKINGNGWAKEDFYVKVTLNDQSGLGIKNAKWCISQENTCIPLTNMEGNTVTPLISTESNNNRICIQATDNNNRTSEVLCSDAYKLDKTVPNVGTFNITGTIGSNEWYTSDVSISANNGSDFLSGHSTSSVDISNINYNTSETTVTLTTIDLAGNTNTATKTMKVDKDYPSIVANQTSATVIQGSSDDVSSYFTITYSTSGGNTVCTPTNTSGLSIGIQTVNCIVIGSNGLSSSASISLTIQNSIYSFGYTGIVQSVTLPSGNYKLEVWGAQGGNGYEDGYIINGGKGGYSTGNLNVTTNTTLYIVVGESGIDDCRGSCEGGKYNGGGDGYRKIINNSSFGSYSGYYGSDGGGATHMATKDGILSSLNSDKSDVVIVAGGGGGGAGGATAGSCSSGYYCSGGSGGGVNGISAIADYFQIYSQSSISIPGTGTQNDGGLGGTGSFGAVTANSGLFGQGGSSNVNGLTGNFGSIEGTQAGGGGGGGWYGGGGGNYVSGSGGSGYLSPFLTNATTISGDNSMPSTSGGIETGHDGAGYAKITYLGP